MAFTTTVGAGGTSLIGTSGVDTTTFAPGTLATSVFIGAQGDNDFITLQANQANSYTIKGGAGNDTITAAGFRNSLVTGDDGTDTITVTGTIQSATVSGLEGIDTIAVQNINGGLVNGNNGNDIMSAAGNGTAASTFTNNGKLVGGQGNDAITLGAAGANNGLTLTSGLVNGQDGDDTITITQVTAMTFGGGSTIYGGQGSDIINGSANTAALVLSGDLGADNISGSTVNDTIFGGDGNDRITGGTGADSMVGGEGIDTFVQTTANASPANAAAVTATGATYTFAAGIDTITDFAAGANGDIVSFGNGALLAPAAITTGWAATNLTVGRTYAVSGNLSNGVFTVTTAGTGSDTLLLAGTGGTFDAAIVAAGSQVILTGVNINTLVGANLS